MDSVAAIEVTAKYSTEVRADQLFDHFPFARMMVFKIADGRRADTPDGAIDAILSPSCLISLHRRTGTDLSFERIQLRRQLDGDPVQEFHNLATADGNPVQREQIRLDLSNGQTHHGAQRGDQTGQPHSDASLTEHLLMEIDRGLVPFVAPATPPLVDPLFPHLNWWWRGNTNDFSATCQTDASQT